MWISEFLKSLKSYRFNPQFLKYFSPGQQKVLFIVAIFLFAILYFRFHHPSPPPSGKITKEFVVEVMGEIRSPGVYIFTHPPSLQESIEKAGGLRNPAFFDETFDSEPLKTGTLLIVRKESQQEVRIKIETMDANKLLVFNIPLDLNRVPKEDLCLIPGIGESLAHEIVSYRERRKGFRSIEELKNVKGIGDKKFETLKPFLTLK